MKILTITSVLCQVKSAPSSVPETSRFNLTCGRTAISSNVSVVERVGKVSAVVSKNKASDSRKDIKKS